jgi:hypothetical protein
MKKHFLFCGVLIAWAVFALACATDANKNNSAPTASAEIKTALDSITSDDLLKHIKTLASDEYEGRAPGAKGEELTVNYLTEQFKAFGLKPGNPDGTYVQKVPLVGYTPQPTASFTVGGKSMPLAAEDYLARSPRFTPEVKVRNSDLVFVGYGVVAPEYGWDDFKGVDVKGKTVVFLINDPAIPDPNDPNKLDEKMFKGRAMTYYGRWTYKYEIASEKGAAAAIIVHETGPAGYPFAALASWRQENFGIKTPDDNSTLDDLLVEAASAQGRVVKPDAEPEKGFFYRSDHFEFAKQGVPALYTNEGTEFIGKPDGYGMQKRKEYTERDYHKVSDEVKPDWDLSGAVEDLQLLFRVGYGVAQGEKWPEWKPGTEFKARREESLRRARA